MGPSVLQVVRMKKLQQFIEAGYKSLGCEELGRGYRFLSFPKSTIGADRLVMSINPAGNRPDWENDAIFTEEGKSAHVDERWGKRRWADH